MILFGSIKYLLLLLLIPVILIAYGVSMALRRRRIAKFGDPKLVGELMPHWSGARGWVKICFFCLALFFFIIGLARPQIGAKLSQKERKGVEIMICLDVSNSMLAQDFTPNRLERAKLAIGRLTDKLRDDRIGLVVFAGTSYVQLPITADYVSAKMFLSSIGTESVAIQGTDIGEAIRLAMNCFSEQSEKSRVIIVITDGEDHEQAAVDMAKEAAEMGIRIYTIGVGDKNGVPIPIGDNEFMKDREGETVMTRLNETVLQEIAAAGGGAYVKAGREEFGLNTIIDDIRSMEGETFKAVVFEEYDEQYVVFYALALLLLVIEMLIGDRRSGRKMF